LVMDFQHSTLRSHNNSNLVFILLLLLPNNFTRDKIQYLSFFQISNNNSIFRRCDPVQLFKAPPNHILTSIWQLYFSSTSDHRKQSTLLAYLDLSWSNCISKFGSCKEDYHMYLYLHLDRDLSNILARFQLFESSCFLAAINRIC
jgi:hypothetical protein